MRDESVLHVADDVSTVSRCPHDGGARENTSYRVSLTSFPPFPYPHPPSHRLHIHYPTSSSPTFAPDARLSLAHRLDLGVTIA